MANYKFDNYVLKNGNRLMKNGALITLPPKELALLNLLLEKAGEITTKNDIVERVWSGSAVSDESITRCIYSLRQTLSEGQHKKYIETVYGKGYAFASEVTSDSKAIPCKNKIRLALFPYQMKNKNFSFALYDLLLSYCLAMLDRKSDYSLLPLSLTGHCDNDFSVINSVKETALDYFITGVEVDYQQHPVIRLELVRAADLQVIKRTTVPLKHLLEEDIIENQQALIELFCALEETVSLHSTAACRGDEKRIMPVLKKKTSPAFLGKCSLLNAEMILNGQFNPLSVYAFSSAGRCYKETLAVASTQAVSEKNHEVIMALQSITAGSHAEAAERFKQAVLMAPDNHRVYYYYACYLFRTGVFEQAMRLVNSALALSPGYLPARLMQVALHLEMREEEKAQANMLRISKDNQYCGVIKQGVMKMYNSTVSKILMIAENKNTPVAGCLLNNIAEPAQ